MRTAAGRGACDVPCECGPALSPLELHRPRPLCCERTATRNQPLFTEPQMLGSDPLNAKDLNFPVALGYQVSAIRHDVCGCDWEVGYFQVDGFAAEAAVPGISYMVTDVNGTDFPGRTTARPATNRPSTAAK